MKMKMRTPTQADFALQAEHEFLPRQILLISGMK